LNAVMPIDGLDAYTRDNNIWRMWHA